MTYSTHDSYRRAWNEATKTDPPIPLNVDLELASVCNLRCPSCFIPDPAFEKFISQKSEDGRPLRRLMSKEIAFQIISECADLGVPALKFNWRGESTLHPDYAEIVSYAANKNLFIELLANTNANCTDKAVDGLMACTKVMVSLDSLDPDTYLKMRVGGSLARAKEVVNELVKRKHPNLWVRRVLTKLNYQEPFLQQVKTEWGDSVHASQHYCFDRNKTVANEISGCDHDISGERAYCAYPSQRLVIGSTGKVYPCCIDLHETMPVGDMNKQHLIEIWHGSLLRNLRASLRSLNTKTWSKTCLNCESWMSYNKPQRDFVQDIELVEGMTNG